MTKIDQLKAVTYSLQSQLVAPQLLLMLLVLVSLSLLSSRPLAQGVSLNLTDDLSPDLDPATRAITDIASEFGAYDQRQIEMLEDLGRLSQSDGEFQQALALQKQALHVSRINLGLYHESQISLIDDIISSQIALRNWEDVNNYFAYQEHLYRRLFAMNDPRLEVGLRKISAWHITALNINLEGKRIEHLRKANKLFKLRMEVAENTLAVDDPKFAVLARNIEAFERELYLSSDLNSEMLVRRQKESRTRRSSYRQSDSSLVVTSD